MVKYFRISSYIMKPFLIYDFLTNPIWISLYIRKISFIFYQWIHLSQVSRNAYLSSWAISEQRLCRSFIAFFREFQQNSRMATYGIVWAFSKLTTHNILTNLTKFVISNPKVGILNCLVAVLQIRDILVRIRIRGSVPLTNGSRSSSGSGSCSFRHWLSRRQQKYYF